MLSFLLLLVFLSKISLLTIYLVLIFIFNFSVKSLIYGKIKCVGYLGGHPLNKNFEKIFTILYLIIVEY